MDLGVARDLESGPVGPAQPSILNGSGGMPSFLAPASLIFTFLLVIAGGLALVAKPKVAAAE